MIDRRAFFRTTLADVYLPFYDALCRRLDSRWQPYSGTRDFDAQTRLYAQGRTLPGGVVTWAKAGESAHNYGCATDWTLFDGPKPIWPTRGDAIWKDYIEAVRSVGLKAGVDFGDVDHNEILLTCDWKEILSCYTKGGMELAMAKVAESKP